MAKNGDRPQKVTELAEALGVDPALLSKSPNTSSSHLFD